MILLTGNSLNERHRELNNKVIEAAKQSVSFDDVKAQTEESDVDRLFKIKLADKYKNAEYIIETLKCGDSLYISKALKCTWLYDEEFSNIINPDYIGKNIFPEMSFKMRRKFLTVISMHLDNDRAASFYTYCMQINLHKIAIKFLLKTSETFKVDIIQGNDKPNLSDENAIALIGNSFTVASAVLETLEKDRIAKYLKSLRHLHSVSDVKYLDLVEKNILKHKLEWKSPLGLRISKNIIKNHKDRILRNTLLYTNMINKSILIKYCSPDDVKDFLVRLLPPQSFFFWNDMFYIKYKYLINLIPLQERLQYIKKIFNTCYPKEEFETDINFYYVGLYELMTKEEKEHWALKHVEAAAEHFGPGQDFQWYKFVSFEKAFVAIKNYLCILSNADPDVRNVYVRVLIHSAQTDRELETLFKYYFEGHINEITSLKICFIDEVLSTHEYFTFDVDCWNAFNKILYSVDVYNEMNAYRCKVEYIIIAIIYAIMNKKDLHSSLKRYIDDGICMKEFKKQSDKLPEDKRELVYEHLLNVYLEKIGEFDIDNYDGDIQNSVGKYIQDVLDFMWQYNKSKKDIPRLVMKIVEVYSEEYGNHSIFKEEIKNQTLTQDILLKNLKNDAALVVSKIPSVNITIKENSSFQLSKFLRKLRTYFSNDIVLNYIDLFKVLLTSDVSSKKPCDLAVYGILQLTRNSDTIDFITKYISKESKVSDDAIEPKLLYIRTAICKFLCTLRPIISLHFLQISGIGDHIKLNFPWIGSFTANLQPALLKEFVKFLLKSPTLHKHGLRLAFEYFNLEELKEIIMDFAKNNVNFSLRQIVHRAVHDKIIKETDENVQIELFDLLKTFVLGVCEDDEDNYFNLLIQFDLPKHILDEHTKNVWLALTALPDTRKITTYKRGFIENIIFIMNGIQQNIIDLIVSEHIKNMLTEGKMKHKYDNHIKKLIEAKWNLTTKYLTFFPNKDAIKRKLEIVQSIVKQCITSWNKLDSNTFVVRAFLMEFINNLQNSFNYKEKNTCVRGIRILEVILNELEEALPLIEIYEAVWFLRVNITIMTIIVEGHKMAENEDNSYNYQDIFLKCLDRFATEFTIMFKDFIDRGKYYKSASCVIFKILTNAGITLIRKLPHIVYLYLNDMFVVLCSKLLEVEKLETYYFALDLLPKKYGNADQLYRSVINKLKNFESDEIKHFLYRKIVCDNEYESTIFDENSDFNLDSTDDYYGEFRGYYYNSDEFDDDDDICIS